MLRLLAMVGIVVGIGAILARSAWFFIVGPEAVAIAALPRAAAPPQAAFNVDQVATANLFGDPAAANQRASENALRDTPDTRLNLELAAVYQADNPEDSLAIIGAQGRAHEAYRIGDAIPGNARLVQIHRGQVVISRDGVRERLRFDEDPPTFVAQFEQDDEASAAAPRMPAAAPLPVRSDAEPLPPAGRQVARADWDRLLEAPQDALEATGLAAVSDADVRGYRVGPLASSPHLARTGLQSGDVILSMNGRPVGDLSQDRARLDEAIAGGSVRLEIQRGERRFFVTAAVP